MHKVSLIPKIDKLRPQFNYWDLFANFVLLERLEYINGARYYYSFVRH